MPSLTYEEISAAMLEAVQNNGKLRKRFNALIEFQVEGIDESLRLDLVDPTATSKPAKLVVLSPLDTLCSLLERKTTPQKAFMKGDIKIKGKMALAMKLQGLLDATRKHLKKQTARL